MRVRSTSNPNRLAMFLLLGLFVASADAAEVTARLFKNQVQPALNPQLSAWVTAQTGVAKRSTGVVDVAALRRSAAAALGTRKATPESIEVLVGLVMVEILRHEDGEVRQIADRIDRNDALKNQIREVMALLRGRDTKVVTDLLDANPTLIGMRQKRIDEIRKALEDARSLQGVSSDLALALQMALTRASQALQLLANVLAAYSRNAPTIIDNIRG